VTGTDEYRHPWHGKLDAYADMMADELEAKGDMEGALREREFAHAARRENAYFSQFKNAKERSEYIGGAK
jgi:hypothetical protein